MRIDYARRTVNRVLMAPVPAAVVALIYNNIAWLGSCEQAALAQLEFKK